ncbi:von Willebrand factor, type A [Pelomyxa schiedti]|nr:von Willebrand factor, type A [Pelomyxa schiedti]
MADNQQPPAPSVSTAPEPTQIQMQTPPQATGAQLGQQRTLTARVHRQGASDPDFDVPAPIEPGHTILELKALISAACGVEVHQQKLYVSGQLLSNSDPIMGLGAEGAVVPIILAEVGEEAQYEGWTTAGPGSPPSSNKSVFGETPKRGSSATLGSHCGVDVVFSFDTTGSMYNKLDEVRRSLLETVEGLIQALPDVRFGVIAHGDYSDSYTSYTLRRFDLTSDAKAACTFIRTVSGTWGGDFPECYELALREARSMSWRASARRVLVLIGDSEPHPPSFTDQDIFWKDEAELLHSMGITLYTVYVSNHDAESSAVGNEPILAAQTAPLFWSEAARLAGGLMLDNVSNLSFLIEMLRTLCNNSATESSEQDWRVAVLKSVNASSNHTQVHLAEEIKPTLSEIEHLNYWSRENDSGQIKYWYDIRWNKWNPKPIGHRFHLPRYPMDQRVWALIANYLSINNADLLTLLAQTCQTLMRCVTWRVEFSLEYFTKPGEEVYIIGNTIPLGNWNLEIKNRMLWTSGHIWRLTKRIVPGSLFIYKYAVKFPDGHIRYEDASRMWERRPRDTYAAVSFITQRTVLIRDYWGYPVSLRRRDLLISDADDDSILPPHQDNVGTSAMELRAIPEFASIDSNAAQLLTLVHLNAPRAEATLDSRAGTDLIAVIDVSGSMSGSKLHSVQNTLKSLVRNLSAADRLCLITFDDSAYRLTRLQRMDQCTKDYFYVIIDSMLDLGGTSIRTGLSKAIQVLEKRTYTNPVTAVMLLTDGQDYLTTDVAKTLFSQTTVQFSLYTFGYGPDHDATLLSSLAELGHGMFYYIENDSKVEEAFARCLGGLLSVYAQNLRVTINSANNSQILKLNTSFPVTQRTPDRVCITLPDVFCEENRDIPLVVQLPSFNSAAASSPTSNICYLVVDVEYDVAATQTHQAISCNMTVSRTLDASLMHTGPNLDVDLQRNRVTVATAIGAAATAASNHRFDEARKVLLDAQQSVKTSATANNPFILGLLSDISKSLSAVSSEIAFNSGGFQFMQQQLQSHWLQRASHTSDLYQNESQANFTQGH